MTLNEYTRFLDIMQMNGLDGAITLHLANGDEFQGYAAAVPHAGTVLFTSIKLDAPINQPELGAVPLDKPCDYFCVVIEAIVAMETSS